MLPIIKQHLNKKNIKQKFVFYKFLFYFCVYITNNEILCIRKK